MSGLLVGLIVGAAGGVVIGGTLGWIAGRWEHDTPAPPSRPRPPITETDLRPVPPPAVRVHIDGPPVSAVSPERVVAEVRATLRRRGGPDIDRWLR